MRITKNRFTKLKLISSLFIILVIVLWFLKTNIFNTFFTYHYERERLFYGGFNINSEIIQKIERDYAGVKQIDFQEIINYSLNLTSDYLSFHSKNTSNDPNVLVTLKRAHCVGYASFLNAVLNEILNVNTKVKLKSFHVVGKIKFLGIDLHKYLGNNSFLKDHDFNIVVDSGDKYFIDASLFNFIGIGYVKGQDF